jgi:hypothetical protein
VAALPLPSAQDHNAWPLAPPPDLFKVGVITFDVDYNNSNSKSKELSVMARIVQRPTFQLVGPQELLLHGDGEGGGVEIVSLAPRPIAVEAQLNSPHDFVIINPRRVVVEPFCTATIAVSLKDTLKESFTSTLTLQDVASQISTATLPLRCEAPPAPQTPPFDPPPLEKRASGGGGGILLRGCTSVGRATSPHYEINVGQQPLDASQLEWRVAVTNASLRPGSISFFLVDPSAADWLSVSWAAPGRDCCELEGGGTAELVLFLRTRRVGIFSSYVILKGGGGGCDAVVVLVLMEVLSQGQADKPFFSVRVDGLLPALEGAGDGRGGNGGGGAGGGAGGAAAVGMEHHVIDFGVLCAGVLSKNRSLVVENKADIPLEFLLHPPPSSFAAAEVNFSVSNTSLKSVKAITIPPGGSTRVYVHIRPVDPSHLPQPPPLSEAREHTVDVTVKCRLVKDHAEVIKLKWKTTPPQLDVPTDRSLVFVGGEEDLRAGRALDPPRHVVSLRNRFASPLYFAVHNPSRFFDVVVDGAPSLPPPTPTPTPCDGVSLFCAAPNQPFSIVFKPKASLSAGEIDAVLKGKYIEELVLFYNYANLAEAYIFSPSISLGHVRAFFAAPLGRKSFAYAALEADIVKALTTFFRRTPTPPPPPPFDAELETLLFDTHRIADELVLYGLKGQVASTFALATLFFQGLFSHPSFAAVRAAAGQGGGAPLLPDALGLLVRNLQHLLEFFPEPARELDTLQRAEVALRPFVAATTPRRGGWKYSSFISFAARGEADESEAS